MVLDGIIDDLIGLYQNDSIPEKERQIGLNVFDPGVFRL